MVLDSMTESLILGFCEISILFALLSPQVLIVANIFVHEKELTFLTCIPLRLSLRHVWRCCSRGRLVIFEISFNSIDNFYLNIFVT